MIRNALNAIALACLALPAASPAATASARIEDISVRVFDLNYSDNVSPQVTWLTAQTVVQVSGENAPLAQTFNDTGVSQTFMAPIVRSGSQTAVGAQAGLGVDTIWATGSALAPYTEFQSVAKTGQTTFNTGVIGPWTQLIFTATAFVSASVIDLCVSPGGCDLAEATVSLFARAPQIQNHAAQGITARAVGNTYFPAQVNVVGDSHALQFNYVLNNPGPTAQPFEFMLTASAYGRELSPHASPVSELPTVATFLLGVGWLAQRHARLRRAQP